MSVTTIIYLIIQIVAGAIGGNIFAKVTQFTLGRQFDCRRGRRRPRRPHLPKLGSGADRRHYNRLRTSPGGDWRRQRRDRHRVCKSLHASYRLLSHATSAIEGLMVSHGCRKSRSHCSVPVCAQSSISRASFSITWFSMIEESSRV